MDSSNFARHGIKTSSEMGSNIDDGLAFIDGIGSLDLTGGTDDVLHLLCTQGSMSFMLQGMRCNVVRSDYVIMTNPGLVSGIAASQDFDGIIMRLSERYVASLTLRSNYGVTGHLSLLQNPVMKLSLHDFLICRDAMLNLRTRLADGTHIFREEMLQHLLMAHILDLYDIHARCHVHATVPERAAQLMGQFVRLLYDGEHLRHRDLAHYASRLCITPHYLTEISKKTSGKPATYWIDRFTLHEATKLLARKEMPLSEVAERLHFSSLSYFSRYVLKRLGMPPSEYRNRK